MTEPTNSLGKNMTILAWILFLVLMTYLFESYLTKQQNPNQTVETLQTEQNQSVVLQQNRLGHYVANGKINGEPVVLFLDTGATDVSVPENVANQLGLDKGRPYSIYTANGVITVYRTYLDEVTIGGILLRDVAAHINPMDSGKFVLLGMSFLKQLEFSQQQDKLILKQPYF